MSAAADLLAHIDRNEAARKARKAAKAQKAARVDYQAAKAARKAAEAAGAGGPVSHGLGSALSDIAALVGKMAAEDSRRVVIPSGIAPVLRDRGPQQDNVFKALDYEVDDARKAVHEAGSDMEQMRARDDLRGALQKRATVKLIAADNARASGALPPARFGPNSAQLFTSTHTLDDDTGLRYMGRSDKYIGVGER